MKQVFYCMSEVKNTKCLECEKEMKVFSITGKEDEITQAKNLLLKNGYIVKKWTLSMERDANECTEMEKHGKQKNCSGCSCSVCLIQ